MILAVLQYNKGIYTLSNGQTVGYEELSKMKDSVYGLHYQDNKLVFVDIHNNYLQNRTRNNLTTNKYMAIHTNSVLYAPSSASAAHNAVTTKRLSHHVVESYYLDGKKYHVNKDNMFESFCEYDLVGKVFPFYWDKTMTPEQKLSEIKAFPYLIRTIKNKTKGENAICDVWDLPNATYETHDKNPYYVKSTPRVEITLAELIMLWKNYINNDINNTYITIQNMMTLKGYTQNQIIYVLEHINLTPIWELGYGKNNTVIYGIFTLDKGVELVEISSINNTSESTLNTTIRTKLVTKGILPQAFRVTETGELESCVINWPKKYFGSPFCRSAKRTKAVQNEITNLINTNRCFIEIPRSVVTLKEKSTTLYTETISYFPSSIKKVEKNSIRILGSAWLLRKTTIHLEECNSAVQKEIKKQILESAAKKIKAFILEANRYSYAHKKFLHNYTDWLHIEDTEENTQMVKNMTLEEIIEKSINELPSIITQVN